MEVIFQNLCFHRVVDNSQGWEVLPLKTVSSHLNKMINRKIYVIIIYRERNKKKTKKEKRKRRNEGEGNSQLPWWCISLQSLLLLYDIFNFLFVARVGENNPMPDVEQQAPNDLKSPA